MKERGKEQRGMRSRMETGGASDEAQLFSFFSPLRPLHQFPAIFLHLAKHQFHFLFPLSLSVFLKPLFPSCMSFSLSCRFPLSLIPNSTTTFNSKTTIPLLVTEQSQSVSLLTARGLFQTKAAQFSDCKENPLAPWKELRTQSFCLCEIIILSQ